MEEIHPLDVPKSAKYFVRLIICWGMAGWFVGSKVDAQALAQIRSDVNAVSPPKKEQPKKKKRKHDHHHHHDDEDKNNFVGELFGAIFFGSSNQSSSASSSSSFSSSTSSQTNDIDYEIYSTPDPAVSFLGYPYAENQTGITSLENSLGQPYQFQTSFWYGTDFDNIDSWNGQLRIDNQDTLGFEMQWSHLTEKLTGVTRDSLNLADFNLTWRWIESEPFIVRLGGGVNLLTDRFGTTADYNLTLSADFFPVKPIVASFEFDYGELGAIHHNHLLTTFGMNLRHMEVMTGYEFRNLGGTEIHGPLLGMRLWW